MRALIALTLCLGCATTPESLLSQMDVETDSEATSAAAAAIKQLKNSKQDLAVRLAAAKLLGRIGARTPEAIESLSYVLADGGELVELRAFAAWALGEMRSDASLAALTLALERAPPEPAGERVLEALAKHHALLSSDTDRFVLIVEAMVGYASKQRRAVPALYDLIGARTRTIPVNVKVLTRAAQAAKKGGDRASMYTAAFELFARIEASKGEITAGGEAWSARLEAAAQAADLALSTGDPDTALLVLWYLGRLSELREIAAPAALVLVGPRGEDADRPSKMKSARLRLVAAWALAKMQLHAIGPRRALLLDVLAREVEPEVLRLVGDLSARQEDHDLIQKLVGLE